MSSRDLFVGMREASDVTAAAVLRHRNEGRLADASVELERWVAACRKQTPAFFALGGGGMSAEPSAYGAHATPRMGVLGRLATRKGAAFQSAGDVDDAAADSSAEKLRERVPELRRLFEPEVLTFVIQVRKTNAVGKVQSRLLVVTDSAVCNLDGRRVKRRIPLAALSLVTAAEHTGQLILHVPSDYDYLVATPTRGYSVLEDSVPPGSALSGFIAALQRAYAQHVARTPNLAGAQAHLPVRTFNDAGPLAALVKKKGAGGSGSGSTRFSVEDGDALVPVYGDEDED